MIDVQNYSWKIFLSPLEPMCEPQVPSTACLLRSLSHVSWLHCVRGLTIKIPTGQVAIHVLFGYQDHKGNNMSQVSINQPAPDFSLTRFAGEQFRLSDLQGHKNVVLIFNRGFT